MDVSQVRVVALWTASNLPRPLRASDARVLSSRCTRARDRTLFVGRVRPGQHQYRLTLLVLKRWQANHQGLSEGVPVVRH